ncbi:MAG: amidohydrolase family protein [Acidobacteria bacterium]|nr:amidohydrolase family protein [Acidobacteriota bacterium]
MCKTREMLAALSLLLFCGIAEAQNMATVPEEIVIYPDRIIHNGKIATMDDTSFGLNTSPGTMAEAMAIRDGKIQAVGSNDRILRMAGPETDKIDVNGRTVMPGIIDAHTHIHNTSLSYWLGQNPEALESVSHSYVIAGTRDTELEQGIVFSVEQHVEDTQPDRWAFVTVGSREGPSGMAPGVAFLQERKFPKQRLDSIAPNHPVLLHSHPAYVMNSAAIRAMEELYGSELSAEAVDEYGNAHNTAAQYNRELIIDQYFHTRVGQLAEIVEDGLAKSAAVGITTYNSHIMGLRFLDAFNVLARQNRMPIRFAYTHWFGFQAGYQEAENFYRRMGDMAGMGNDYLWQTAVGLGSIDSGPPRICSTMEAPRAVKEKEFCQNFAGTLTYRATKTAIANYQRVSVGHSYGDKSVDYVMDAVEEAMRDNPAITLDYIRSRRLTTDHCGFYPRKEQLPRLKRLGFIIACGGNMLSRSYPWLERYSPEYANRISPVRSIIEAGVRVVLEDEGGSTVRRGNTAASYFRDASTLLTRKNEQGAFVAPEEAIDRITLMKMMTSWASLFVLKEDVLGTLEPGKFADFLVLNKDYFTIPIEEMPNTIPLMTVVGGKIVVLRNELAQELGRDPVGPQIEFRNDPLYSRPERPAM